jgi:hypothetical protein
VQKRIIILLGVVIFAIAFIRAKGKTKSPLFSHLKGWQKLFGVLAIIATLLIVMNPEFIALGILGDTTFFEILILALSLQMHAYAIGVFRSGIEWFSRTRRWLGIPSPGLRFALAIVMPTLAIGVNAIQKTVQRIFS